MAGFFERIITGIFFAGGGGGDFYIVFMEPHMAFCYAHLSDFWSEYAAMYSKTVSKDHPIGHKKWPL